MTAKLAFPFRLLPNGSAATVEQNSDDGDREAVAMLVLTRIGERPLEPGFGIPDPAFAGFEATELAAALAIYGPQVEITAVDVDVDRMPDTQLVHIEFT